MKTCTYCGLVKPADEFYPDKRTPGKLTARCKSCLNEAASRYNHEHLKYLNAQARYRRLNRRMNQAP